jgi:hypothetical protein
MLFERAFPILLLLYSVRAWGMLLCFAACFLFKGFQLFKVTGDIFERKASHSTRSASQCSAKVLAAFVMIS